MFESPRTLFQFEAHLIRTMFVARAVHFMVVETEHEDLEEEEDDTESAPFRTPCRAGDVEDTGKRDKYGLNACGERGDEVVLEKAREEVYVRHVRMLLALLVLEEHRTGRDTDKADDKDEEDPLYDPIFRVLDSDKSGEYKHPCADGVITDVVACYSKRRHMAVVACDRSVDKVGEPCDGKEPDLVFIVVCCDEVENTHDKNAEADECDRVCGERKRFEEKRERAEEEVAPLFLKRCPVSFATVVCGLHVLTIREVLLFEKFAYFVDTRYLYKQVHSMCISGQAGSPQTQGQYVQGRAVDQTIKTAKV